MYRPREPPCPASDSWILPRCDPFEPGITDVNNGLLPDLSSWTGLVGGAQACLHMGPLPQSCPLCEA